MQTYLERGPSEQPKQRQSMQAENAQSDKITCIRFQNKSRSGTESRLSNSHHFYSPSQHSATGWFQRIWTSLLFLM